jgi:hypothetical protein
MATKLGTSTRSAAPRAPRWPRAELAALSCPRAELAALSCPRAALAALSCPRAALAALSCPRADPPAPVRSASTEVPTMVVSAGRMATKLGTSTRSAAPRAPSWPR